MIKAGLEQRMSGPSLATLIILSKSALYSPFVYDLGNISLKVLLPPKLGWKNTTVLNLIKGPLRCVLCVLKVTISVSRVRTEKIMYAYINPVMILSNAHLFFMRHV